MILTFYGSSKDTKWKDIFLKCTIQYANPIIVWKKANKREVLISRDGSKKRLTGKITLSQIEAAIREMLPEMPT